MEQSKKVENILNHIFNIVNIFSGQILGLMVILVLVQVVGRYFFNHSFSWAEELPIFLFAWTAFLGASVALYKDEHLSLEFIYRLITGKKGKVMKSTCYILGLLFVVVLIIYGIKFANMLKSVTFTVINVSKAYFYSSLVISSVLMAIVFIVKTVLIWKK